MNFGIAAQNGETPINNGDVPRILKSVVLAMGLSMVMMAVIAGAMLVSPIPESVLRPITMIISAVCILIGAVSTGRGRTDKAWLWGGYTGVAYMLILYIISIALSGFDISSSTFAMLALGFASGAIGAALGKNMRHGKGRRR